MSGFAWGSTSWTFRLLRWLKSLTNRPQLPLLLLAPLWLLFGASGCTTAREVGFSAARGVSDWAHSPEGQAQLRALTDPAIEAGRKMLADQWDAKKADLDRKVADGTASKLEWMLWLLAGAAGGGPTLGKLVERLLIGKRSVPEVDSRA